MATHVAKPLMSYLAPHPAEAPRGIAVKGSLEDPLGYKPGDTVNIHMSKEALELTQKVNEAVDASGKVELMFVEERAERRQAVNDIWEKLRELQGELRSVKTAERTVEKQAPAPQAAPQAALPMGMDRNMMMQEDLASARIEKELATHRAQMQELRFMCEGNASRGNESGQGQSGEAILDLSRKQADLDLEVANLRELWVEVQMGLSMSAVRASRIALRTADLSDKGRKQALTILEGKEEAIAKQFDDIRQERGINFSAQLSLPDPLESVGMAETGSRTVGATLSGSVFAAGSRRAV